MTKILSHIGVLGMHWGKRKAQGGGTLAEKGSGKGSADHQKTIGLKKKRLRDLSNEELSVLTKRMQLEKSYKELSKADLSAGQKFLSETLQATGKQLASKYLANISEAAGKAILEALKNKFNKP